MTIEKGLVLQRRLHGVRRRFLRWWRGEFVRYETRPGEAIPLFPGYQKRHWTSRFTHVLVDFYLEHWKWLITTALAGGGLWCTLLWGK